MSRHKLDTANKLLLLQGISQIESGLEMLEWIDDIVNENSRDYLSILRDRFSFYKESALYDGKCDYFLVDKANNNLENVQGGYDFNNKIKSELKELRKIVVNEKNHFEKEDKKQLIEDAKKLLLK